MVIAPDILAQLMAYHCFYQPEAEMAAVIETFAATRASAFLEIGTHKGFTSACISLAFPQARVVSVDLPDPTRTQWNPLARSLVGEAHRAFGLERRIEQRFVDSAELWRFAGKGESFDLVFVDGDHSPHAVFRDLTLAADLVPRNGGVVLAHDFTDAHEACRPIWTVGVQQAVDQFLEVRPFRKRRLAGLLVALEALERSDTTSFPTLTTMTGDYSQNGEQVVIDEILSRLTLSSRTVVDLGAGDGWALSNTRHLLHNGWRGVLIDADNRGNCEVHEHFLTAENVVSVVSSYTQSADVLSVDLDGNDYWILNALLAVFTPALIVCEVNPRFEREEVKVMAYNPEHRWQGVDYYGMSIGAVELLCRRFGYSLHDYNGLNAFLIRSDLGVPPKNWHYTPRFDHPPGQGEWTTLA